MEDINVTNLNYTENENHAPNLLNNSVNYNRIVENTTNANSDTKDGNGDDDNLIKHMLENMDNLKTTESEMMFNYFANNEKLVSEVVPFLCCTLTEIFKLICLLSSALTTI